MAGKTETKQATPKGTPLSGAMLAELVRIDQANLGDGGPGITPDLQGFIKRVTEGGERPSKRRDLRVAQAQQLWSFGIGIASYPSFDEYLATIPEVPEFPDRYLECYPKLVLVDRRVSLVALCELCGVKLAKLAGVSPYFVPYTSTEGMGDTPYWMRCATHRFPSNSAQYARGQFTEDDIGCDAFEGIACYAQHASVFRSCHAVFPESVYAAARFEVAALHTLGEPTLGTVRFDDPQRVLVRGRITSGKPIGQ